MIRNEKQKKVAKKQFREFDNTFSSLTKEYEVKPNLRLKIQIDAIHSDMQKIEKEIQVYEDLYNGITKKITVETLEEFPLLMIKARIARHMTQKELAVLVGVKEQMIQRYETNNYSNTSFSKILKIAEALDVQCSESIVLAT